MSPLVMLGRLLLAALCSGFIGYERETAQKSAGLRTHTLVGVGAAVFTVASISGFDGPTNHGLRPKSSPAWASSARVRYFATVSS
jgi:putative Mg2+ transporter-C (MgtC) family protein